MHACKQVEVRNMGQVIGVVSQKGGVGKSTLCRTLACEFVKKDWTVKIADLDSSQSTSVEWNSRRISRAIQPEISVEQFSRVSKALEHSPHYDLMILDGAPHATRATLEIAKESQMVILPTGTTLDDMYPTVKLARELHRSEIPLGRIYVLLSKVGDSYLEIREAREWLHQTGLTVLKGEIPDKTSYKRALDEGHCLTETRFSSLNKKAESLLNEIIKHFNKLSQ